MKRHCINMARIIIDLTNLSYYNIKFTRDEIDKMIVACLFSSFLKHGWQADYEADDSVRPDYPKLQARAFMAMTGILEKNDMKFIANLIEAHLGKGTPAIDTEYKFLVHAAHYFAGSDNVAIKSKDGFFMFTEDTFHSIEKTICLSDDAVGIIRLALEGAIDSEKAASLGINRSDDEIRAIWSEMLNSRRYTPAQQCYIELATKMQFL